MTFAAPYLLLGLIAVPLAAVGYWLLERRRATRSGAWSREAMLPNIVRRPPRRLGVVPAVLFLFGLTLLLVGFAKPQRVVDGGHAGAPTIVLAFDVSGSMAASDVRPTRIRVARDLALRFLKELPSTYPVAVVTFADNVRVAVAPTLDRKSVIAKLPTAVTPLGGTSIGDGVRRSVAVIVTAADQSDRGSLVRPGATLLFSDGAQTGGGTPLDAAAVSALVDYVPISTIAIGTAGGIVTQPVKLAGGLSSTTDISVPVQPAALHRLSRQTHGAFFDAGSVAQSPAALKAVYRNLSTYASVNPEPHELSAATAGAALVFILAGIALSGLWFGRVA